MYQTKETTWNLGLQSLQIFFEGILQNMSNQETYLDSSLPRNTLF